MNATAVLEAGQAPTQADVSDRWDLGGRWPTRFESPDGVVDADTEDGLRVALEMIDGDGWGCEAGAAVLEALRLRCESWAAQRAKASGIFKEALDPGLVLTAGWETMNSYRGCVAAAQAPWAYLWACVQNALGLDLAADAMLSEKAVRLPRADWPTVLRVGLDTLSLHRRQDSEPDDEAGPLSPAARAVEVFVAHLAGGDTAQAGFWRDAVTRALDVLERSRRSYEEFTLRRDPYLREVLGLSAEELSALAALLIGPRRGVRSAHSLLLALNRDPDAAAADVEGALARIRFLTRRPHARTAAAATVAVAA